ncbi:hypothetical protein A9Q78_09115 [Methylophaga sp. 41_12_T18]|nr:hypothetical protein A9Q78_09115 [Methylophaga sp. 41_12_T18]
MQDEKLPVLIFAQSGRYLAESASQAGYSVWLADCFGDSETRDLADRWQQLPLFEQLNSSQLLTILTNIANGEHCTFICGSGIEKYYSLLAQLPNNFHLVGNTDKIIHQLKTPELFFNLLAQHKLPYPQSQFQLPASPDGWLFKLNTGLGGSHVIAADKADNHNNGYFQQQITGNSGSILFLANGSKTKTLAINKQFTATISPLPFQLSSIETPLRLSAINLQLLSKAINLITQSIGLLGLNSLDFIIDDHEQLFILEVNPRPSASCELIHNKHLFDAHLQACIEILPESVAESPTNTSRLYYLFSPNSFVIPTDMNWPVQCHDRPIAGTKIKQQHPICTVIISASSSKQCQHQYQQLRRQIFNQLNVDT